MAGKMYCEKAIELIRELEGHKHTLPAFNENKLREVIDEVHHLFQENHKDVTSASSQDDNSHYTSLYVRHAAIERNKRCMLGYLYNRADKICRMRWEFGIVLPEDILSNMCTPESQWFFNYSNLLSTYMSSIGDGIGLDLTEAVKPPKTLYIEVRCLVDYGMLEVEDGDTVLLKKGTQHFLPRNQCEALIRQGILQHIIDG